MPESYAVLVSAQQGSQGTPLGDGSVRRPPLTPSHRVQGCSGGAIPANPRPPHVEVLLSASHTPSISSHAFESPLPTPPPPPAS